jgi:Na+/proline symporter
MRPKASQRELVFVGRVMTLVIGVIGLATAFLMSRGKAEDLFRIMVTLFGIATAPVALPMILGLLSKRVGNAGAIRGFVCGLSVGLGLFFLSRTSGQAAIEELIICGVAVKMEIVLFLSTTIVTLVVMAASLLSPVSAEARRRIETFHKRLRTPIGELEEDLATTRQAGYILSPFYVVGMCVLAIGLLMLAVLPWISDSLAFALDAVLGLGLAGLGAIWVRLSRRPASAERQAA